MKKRALILGLILVALVVPFISACAQPAPAPPPVASTLALPEGAVKLSELVPAMGEHWAIPQQLPLGPIYLVHDEEVVGIEYMWSEDMLQEVRTPEGIFNTLVPLPVGVKVDHVTVEFLPDGHEGFEVPHWDLHLYFISPEEREELVPHEH